MEIPFRLLLAANIMSAKKDIRYYLNGVHVANEYVEATDGHRAIRIMAHQRDGDEIIEGYDNGFGENFIIPTDAISNLAKMMTPAERKKVIVTLQEEPGGEGVFSLRSMSDLKIVLFKPIAGTYPNVGAVIPDKEKKPEHHFSYNWKYMVDFQKAAELITLISNSAVLMKPQGSSGALVEFDANYYDEAIGVIMPMRHEK